MYVWISWGSIYKGKRGKIRLCLSTWEHGPHQSPLWTMLLCRSINILRNTDVKSCPGSGSLLSSAVRTFTEAKFALQHVRINCKTLDFISGRFNVTEVLARFIGWVVAWTSRSSVWLQFSLLVWFRLEKWVVKAAEQTCLQAQRSQLDASPLQDLKLVFLNL